MNHRLPQQLQPPQLPQRRTFTTAPWIVPKSIDIPEDKVQLSFVRASGAGGQNVNKVSTKVELKVHVMDEMDFIPDEVRQRLQVQESNRINKEGYLNLSSQEYRTQVQNRKAVLEKLEKIILQAYPRPKIRKQHTGTSQATKERNKEDKRFRSDKKQSRQQVNNKDW